jgi:hypothetical protein
MTEVQQKLYSGCKVEHPETGKRLISGNPIDLLTTWGDSIRVQFNLDNLHLTTHEGNQQLAALTCSIQDLGEQVGRLTRETESVKFLVTKLFAAIGGSVMSSISNALSAILGSGSNAKKRARASEGAEGSEQGAMGSDHGAAQLTPTRPVIALDLTDDYVMDGENVASGSQDLLDDGDAAMRGKQVALAIVGEESVHNALQRTPRGVGNTVGVKLSDYDNAADWFMAVMKSGGFVPAGTGKQQAQACKVCYAWYDAMANDDEKEALLNFKQHQLGAALLIMKKLEPLVSGHMRHLYEMVYGESAVPMGLKLPQRGAKKARLQVSTFENKIRDFGQLLKKDDATKSNDEQRELAKRRAEAFVDVMGGMLKNDSADCRQARFKKPEASIVQAWRAAQPAPIGGRG